jgi:23S rRNA-/tRNA-specific pseudouridylate synthase
MARAKDTIDLPLLHDERDSRRMRQETRPSQTQRRSWKAVTHYRRLGRTSRFSLLELEMETGVTHQIRVHLAAVGHPIVGDKLYGGEDAETFGLQRHFLHARRLTIIHPDSGESLNAEAELPQELSDLLKRLKMNS